MSKAEELLNQVADTGVVAAETIPYFTIDLNSRLISVPAGIKNIGVESDDEVTRLHFKIPRYYNGIDLSEFIIRINYTNANNDGDVYTITDMVATEEEITFSWLVGRFAVTKQGTVTFVVCMIKMDANGYVDREFNSTICTLPVLKGLETVSALVEDQPDAFQSIADEAAKKALEEFDVPEVPNKVSEFENDAGYVTSNDIPTKLSEFENDAGFITEPGGGGGSVPTKISDLENDVGYITNSELEEYIPKAQSRNIAPTLWENASINASGYYPRTDGFSYASSPEFIPVVGGEPYTISWSKGYKACTAYIYQYNADKGYIKRSTIAGMTAAQYSPTTITVEPECAFIRISLYTWETTTTWETLLPEEFQIEHGSTKTNYVLPKLIDSAYIDYTPLVELATKSDYLYGKKLVACGDSITQGFNGEAGSGYYESYAEIVAKRHGMLFTNKGQSGTTMAYNEDGNAQASTYAFSNTRYLDLPEFDYLTLWFGWNDHAYSEVGTIEDTDNTTFYGAYKVVLNHLITNNPTKKIGLVVPYGIKNTKMEAIAKAVRDVSELYGVPCLDLRNYNECSGFWGTDNEAQLARRDALTYDTTHPNQAGHEYLSTMYDAFLKRL